MRSFPETVQTKGNKKRMPVVREYETLYIVVPNLEDSDLKKITDGMVEVANKAGAEIIKNDVWGKRKLAYPIKKNLEGVYVLLRCKGGPNLPRELDTHVKRTPEILRHLTTLVTKQQLKEEARQRALEAKREEEAARREAEAEAQQEAEAEAAREQAEREAQEVQEAVQEESAVEEVAVETSLDEAEGSEAPEEGAAPHSDSTEESPPPLEETGDEEDSAASLTETESAEGEAPVATAETVEENKEDAAG